MLEIIMVIGLLFLLGIIKIEKRPSTSNYQEYVQPPQEEEPDEFIDGFIIGYWLS